MALSNIGVAPTRIISSASAIPCSHLLGMFLLDSSNQANLPTGLPVEFSEVYRCNYLEKAFHA